MTVKDAAFQHRPDIDRLTHILDQAPKRQPSEFSTLDKFGLTVIFLAVLVLLYL